jgi:hypothetical protein
MRPKKDATTRSGDVRARLDPIFKTLGEIAYQAEFRGQAHFAKLVKSGWPDP